MVLKNMLAATIGVMLLASGSLARADELRPNAYRPDAYRPDEFLGLDLSKAALSKKPLGPPSRFAPVQVEAKTDLASEARPVRVERIKRPKVRVAHVQSDSHRVVARDRAIAPPRLVRNHRNPLNAQAFDTRIQVWPCRSGGICNWKPQAN